MYPPISKMEWKTNSITPVSYTHLYEGVIKQPGFGFGDGVIALFKIDNLGACFFYHIIVVEVLPIGFIELGAAEHGAFFTFRCGFGIAFRTPDVVVGLAKVERVGPGFRVSIVRAPIGHHAGVVANAARAAQVVGCLLYTYPSHLPG